MFFGPRFAYDRDCRLRQDPDAVMTRLDMASIGLIRVRR